jgi:hypothetical protein
MTVDASFVFDDPEALLANPIVTGDAPWWEAFTRDYWGRPMEGGVNSWRPITPIGWAILWRLAPGQPLPFHLLSVLLHVVATALAMRLARALRDSDAWAIAVATLFAVHPLNAEAVGAIVAQADLLSFALVLWACLLAVKPASVGRGIGCAVVLALASGAKESAIIFAPLIVLLILLQDGARTKRLASSAPAMLVTIAVVGFQLGLARRDTVAMWGNSLAHEAEGYRRVLLGLYTIGRSLVMSFWPHPLAASHGYAAIELHAEALWPFAAIGIIALAVGIVAGAWAIRTRRVDWIVALSFLYAPALLQSHWFARLITDLAERLLYPSTLGAAMIVAAAVFDWAPQARVRQVAIAGIAVSALLLGVAPRRAWVSDYALWSHGVRVEPKAMRHQYNLSNALILRGELDNAAFHRLVAVYLVNRFPEPVEWNKVEALEALPPPARFAELPEVLYPDAPCPVVVAFLKQNEPIRALHEHVLQSWVERYPGCFRVDR